jgi:hypothetical protein
LLLKANRIRLGTGFRLFGICATAVVLGLPAPSVAADRQYCLSDICPGDLPSVLGKVILSDLSSIAEGGRHKLDLRAALPNFGDTDRNLLERRVAADGRHLVDHRTLAAFLSITAVCAPTGGFVALFSSESGHVTAVEFDVVNFDGKVGFGVKSISRVFRVKSGSPAAVALVADLSRKFGFAVDDPALPALADGLTFSLRAADETMTLSISLPALVRPLEQLPAQEACAPKNRVQLD